MVYIDKTKSLENMDLLAEIEREKVCISYKCSVVETLLDRYTNIAHHAQIASSSIGGRTSIGRYTKIREADIGKYCSIGWDVTIGAPMHPIDKLSSHAFTYRKQFGIVDEDYQYSQKRTVIGNDVWIGCNSVIISGVQIGDGAIIGAGAVVTKNVDAYSIVGGVPAKEIRKRFNSDKIEQLMRLKWWEKDDDWVKKHIDYFSIPVDELDLNELIGR